MGFCVLGLLLAACGQGQKVGSEKLLDIEEQQNTQRLGERTAEPEPEGTPTSLALGEQKTPKPSVAPPTRTPPVFNIELIPNSPYYKPGNALRVVVGVTIKVTNKDATSERSKGRTFTDKNGAFNSGFLKSGQSWTWVFDSPGRFEIIDQGLPFANAALEVVGR
jgi:hypothetical protein